MSAVKSIMKYYARNAELNEFLARALKDAGYGGVEIQRTPVGTRITVRATRPGLVIGRRGTGIKDLTEKVEKKFGFPNPQISVQEIEVPELIPQIMANRISQNMIRGKPFRRAAGWALNAIVGAGALGAEIIISGKLRSERAHFEKYRAGVLPKSGFTKERVVREATEHVLLKMGLYGVKVRIAIREEVIPEVEFLTTEAKAEVKGEAGAEEKAEAKAEPEVPAEAEEKEVEEVAEAKG